MLTSDVSEIARKCAYITQTSVLLVRGAILDWRESI